MSLLTVDRSHVSQHHTRIRNISIADMIDQQVNWIAAILEKEEAPGVIVGLSGTDSILSYILCMEAFIKLNKPLANVRGINFQHQTQDKFVEMNVPFVCMNSDDNNWVEREIFPWLQRSYSSGRLEVDTSISHSKDGARWGSIHDKAKEEVNGRGDMLTGTYYFPVGTRNATEQALGAYTLITGAVSFLPIVNIFKTEVIDLCRYFGVPEIAIEKSQEIDCDCGRFEIQAYHMKELDELLMQRAGFIPTSVLVQGDRYVRHDVECFFMEERVLNEFKTRVPYRPPASIYSVITAGGSNFPRGH